MTRVPNMPGLFSVLLDFQPSVMVLFAKTHIHLLFVRLEHGSWSIEKVLV